MMGTREILMRIGRGANRPARRFRWPWLTLALVGMGLAASALPGAAEYLEYRRAAIEAGEWGRLLTGHLVHWTARMALADLGMLLVLGAWVETRSRRRTLAALGYAAVLVGPGLYYLAPGLATYRGASALASALFVAAAVDLALDAPGAGSRRLARLGLALFAAKLVWEAATGRAIAAGPLLPGVSVTPLAHLLGAAAGFLASVGWPRPASRRPIEPERPAGPASRIGTEWFYWPAGPRRWMSR